MTDFREIKVAAAVVVVQNTFLNLGTRLFKDLFAASHEKQESPLRLQRGKKPVRVRRQKNKDNRREVNIMLSN